MAVFKPEEGTFQRDQNIGKTTSEETVREVLEDLEVGANLGTIKDTGGNRLAELRRLRKIQEVALGFEVEEAE